MAVLTGDNPQTAAAIAREVGLLGEGGGVLSGAELPEDDGVLGALVDRSDGVVISRVTPEDKLRIATAPQHCGHVVAMTGDGVNDGPAYRLPTPAWRWVRREPTWRETPPILPCSTTTSARSWRQCSTGGSRSPTWAAARSTRLYGPARASDWPGLTMGKRLG